MAKGIKYRNITVGSLDSVFVKVSVDKKVGSKHQEPQKPWDVFVRNSGPKDHPLTAVSLFAGCGGLDLGLEQAGFRILWANDIDKDACATYRKNIGIINEGNIRETLFPILDEKIDLLSAGFPCQSFSNAGLRKGINDERGTLYESALKAVEFYHPRIVLFENVRGLMSVKVGDELL